jgi:hypothetical protein
LSCLALPCPALPCSSVCAAAAAPAAQKKGWAKPSRTRKPKGSVPIAYPSVAEDCQRPIANLILYNLTARRAVRDAFPALPFSFLSPSPSPRHSIHAPRRPFSCERALSVWFLQSALGRLRAPIRSVDLFICARTRRRADQGKQTAADTQEHRSPLEPSQVKLVSQSRRGQARTHPVGCLSVCLSRRLRLRRWA